MSYWNIDEVYVSGTNRIPGSKEDHNPMNDNFCQFVRVEQIDDDRITVSLISALPEAKYGRSTFNPYFRDTESNREFFRKLSNPILLIYTHYLIDLLFRGDRKSVV